MKFRHHRSTFNSLGIMLSCDTVLQQWEPYETVSHFEPYLNIYLAKHQFRLQWKVNTWTRLGKWLAKQRKEQGWV